MVQRGATGPLGSERSTLCSAGRHARSARFWLRRLRSARMRVGSKDHV